MKLLFISILLLPMALHCQSASAAEPFFPVSTTGNSQFEYGGSAAFAQKYDNNLDLISPQTLGATQKGDTITEIEGDLFANRRDRYLSLGVDLYALSDFTWNHVNENKLILEGNGFIKFDYQNLRIKLDSAGRFYTKPKQNRYDYIRNESTLDFSLQNFSQFVPHLGLLYFVTNYPHAHRFRYMYVGGFARVSVAINDNLDAWSRYSYKHISGGSPTIPGAVSSSPEFGNRHSIETGFDFYFLSDNTLSASYAYEKDTNSLGTAEQVGDFEFEDTSIEYDFAFNFVKHKVTLLYVKPLSRHLLLSGYLEYIRQNFSDRTRSTPANRLDNLLLASAWIHIRITNPFSIKLRYIFRMNQSSVSSNSFRDHIPYLGLRYEF